MEVRMTVDYEVCVKAHSKEQAEEFVSEKFRAECPDEMFAIDSTLEDVYADEDGYSVPGDEDFDATDEPPPPPKKRSKKKVKNRRSS